MKISEMTNDQATDALVRLAEPFGHICEDAEAIKLFDEFKAMSDNPLIQTVGKMLPQIVAFLLRTHKHDLYEIIGALSFQSADKIAEANFVQTVKLVRESYDEVLLSFFPLSAMRTKGSEEKSSAS